MKRIFALLLALSLLLTGCNVKDGPGMENDVAAAELTSDLVPSDIPAGLAVDASPLLAFSTALFADAVQGGAQNPVLSPLSAYLCLVLAANGAKGATGEAFAKTLGLEQDVLNTFSHDLIAGLTGTSGSTQLSIADSVWADDDKMTLDAAYLQRIVDYCGADAFSYDLPSDAAREAVNAWVNERTRGLIPKLHDENYPDETVLLLINALYFKAKWESPFLAYATYDKTFHKADGGSVSVPFLTSSGYRDLIRTVDADGILLPYDDGKTAFLALRPNDGRTVRKFAADLTAEKFTEYIAGAESTYLEFSMPKFTVEYALNMNDVLSGMGLSVMFDPNQADFSGIGTATDGNIYVSRVIQKVKLIVDEEGTEAAAVTEAAMATGTVMDMAKLHLDSPFLYAVVDLDTGAPLFIGVMDDPA